jgi:hypothetical protein
MSSAKGVLVNLLDNAGRHASDAPAGEQGADEAADLPESRHVVTVEVARTVPIAADSSSQYAISSLKRRRPAGCSEVQRWA